MNDVLTLSEAVPTPEHVPQALVYDFDLFFDPDFAVNPHNRIIDLIKNAPPIFWTPRNGGHWMLMSYGANFETAGDTESCSSEFVPHEQLQAMLAQNPDLQRVPECRIDSEHPPTFHSGNIIDPDALRLVLEA